MTGDIVSREELSARLETIEAKAEANFERIAGELRTNQADLSGRVLSAVGELSQELKGDYTSLKASAASRLTVIVTGVSVFIGIGGIMVALIIGMATSGQAMYGLGFSTRDLATAAAKQAAEEVLKDEKR